MLKNCNLIIQGIAESILMLDQEGNIVFANPEALRTIGYSAEEILNNHLSIFYHPSGDITKSEYELSLAFKKNKFTCEGWRTRKDGSIFWGELSFSVLHNEDDIFIGYTCLLRDITQKKNNELEVKKNEEHYRLMVQGIKDYSILMLDVEGNVLTWNDGSQKITGYFPSEIIGKHFSVFYSHNDVINKKPENDLETAIKTGKYEEEGWSLKKNGSLFWANIVLTPLYNESNRLVGFSKVTRDLSEKKESEENLRQSEERYRLLVEQVTDYGIFMMDDKGRIISWNEGAQKIKGYTSEEIIGKYFTIFYPEEDIISGKPAYELKVAAAVGKYEEEGWRIKKDGSLFWSNIVITAVYNRNRNLIGYSKVTRDLSERKQAEKALKESNKQYRKLADELQIINRDLSIVNEELEQFTSIVSHDLQEPVRTIKSFLQLIEMKLGKGETEELKIYLSKAIKSATNMRELIQNVLHYSQLSKSEIVKQRISVDELIDQTLQNIKSLVEASNAQITIKNEIDAIYGDRVQLVQLVQNLLTNAVKFTGSEKPIISISTTNEKGFIKFAVTDNGIGIPEGHLNKVFEIFRRLNTEKKYPGTGIGLAICKKIIERHHGKIWAESTEGKGTTFYFTISAD